MQNKKIKVLRIIARLNVGGPAIHTVLLTSKLNNDEFESTLVYGQVSKGEGDMSYLLSQYNVPSIFVKTLRREISPLNDAISFYKIRKIIREYKPDIVHTHTAKAGLIGRLAAHFSGIPLKKVHTFHGHTFYGYFNRFKNVIFLNIERLLAKITHKIIAISELQTDEIVNKYKITSQTKCQLIRLGADIDKFLSINPALKQKKSIGYDDNDLIVGTVGRITKIKNHKFFIDIAKEFYNKCKEKKYNDLAARLKFIIVGDGELRGEIENYIDELKLRDRVRITGWQKDVVKYYSAFDVFALTSINEGTPMSIIEAMASGLPIVSTSVGGVPGPELKIMEHGAQNAGYLIDNFDKEDFADKLMRVLDYGFTREAAVHPLGERARKIAEGMFKGDRLVTDIRNLYEKLLLEEKE